MVFGLHSIPTRAQSSVEDVTFAAAQPIIAAIAPSALPEALRVTEPQSAWPAWVAQRHKDISDRLARGDEDTVILWMALGRAFTSQPRLTDILALGRSGESKIADVVAARARDFAVALATGSTADERLSFARAVLRARKVPIDAPTRRAETEQYLVRRTSELLREQRELAARLRDAQLAGDASAVFAAQSTLFSDRGLSLDTSLPPNAAIAGAIEELKRQSVLAPGSVQRVAIVGPGLDFADKDAGFDFYPIQTVQPFAVIEALLRSGVGRDSLTVTTLDISPRVNQHITRARERAARGLEYAVHLPLDDRPWTTELQEYWRSFGALIGRPGTPVASPAVKLRVRAVQLAPATVNRVTPLTLNIVLQRATVPHFDLIVATNVLVYYSVFEQALSLANVEAMLRPGGIFLSNNAVIELPSSKLKSIGYSTTVYSQRPGDGDRIVWYRK